VTHRRPWGQETLWAKTGTYAAKILEIDAGHRTSLQHHQTKEETLLVLTGIVLAAVERDGELLNRTLGPGEVLHLPPGTRHRLEAIERATLVEVSTPELDDVVRHEDDYGRCGAEG
jgi:mannose-6-phosphate isomerase